MTIVPGPNQNVDNCLLSLQSSHPARIITELYCNNALCDFGCESGMAMPGDDKELHQRGPKVLGSRSSLGTGCFGWGTRARLTYFERSTLKSEFHWGSMGCSKVPPSCLVCLGKVALPQSDVGCGAEDKAHCSLQEVVSLLRQHGPSNRMLARPPARMCLRSRPRLSRESK